MLWICPKCTSGKLGPSRMRGDDVRAFCFPCSTSTGRMVKRISPARESAKTTKEARAKVASDKRAVERLAARARARDAATERAAAKQAIRTAPIVEVAKLSGDVAFREAIARYCLLKAWEQPIKIRELVIRYGDRPWTTGRAWPRHGRIAITCGSNLADNHATAIHEIAHLAAGEDHGHDHRFLLLAVKELTGIEVRPAAWDKSSVQAAVQVAVARYLFGEKSEVA
jgi:hypothetical protein